MAARVRWRGNTTARGYGWTHQRDRRQIQPVVDRGEAYCTETICLMRTRWIPPGTNWDLAHTTDRTGYHGPAHRRCNRSEGARRGNLTRQAIAAAFKPAAANSETRWQPKQSRW